MRSPEGRLAACPSSPNCVGSGESGRSYIAPFAFGDTPASALARLKRILTSWPRTRIVEATDDYLHAEVKSRIFGFVDDVEFLIDGPESRVHVRSAARVGYSDFGVNRRRVEALRVRFAAEKE